MGKVGTRAIAAMLLAATLISIIPASLSVFAEADYEDYWKPTTTVSAEGYIEGPLKLTLEGEVTDTVELYEGSKECLFTEFDGELDGSERYTWQILINEEKNRLDNHLKYFISTMESGHGQGKKLGFIAQEMGREINTLGSKSNHAEMQKIVVQMKDELEQIKEQVLNVL